MAMPIMEQLLSLKGLASETRLFLLRSYRCDNNPTKKCCKRPNTLCQMQPTSQAASSLLTLSTFRERGRKKS